tara:strand:+ start:1412 stop:2032 length:621 start_codon:yes stop_codon:yes gene_type:complete
MKKILIINKHGSISEKKINVTGIELDNLDIVKISAKLEGKEINRECDYEFNDLVISIYAFNEGHHSSVNKFDLPPPIDNNLYYNCIIVIAHKNKKIIDYNLKMFNEFYESAFGGFEDLNKEDSWSEQEEETSADRDFIVNDDKIEYRSSASESEDEKEFDFGEETEETEEISLHSSPNSYENLIEANPLQSDIINELEHDTIVNEC